jgi:hypothetical protein
MLRSKFYSYTATDSADKESVAATDESTTNLMNITPQTFSGCRNVDLKDFSIVDAIKIFKNCDGQLENVIWSIIRKTIKSVSTGISWKKLQFPVPYSAKPTPRPSKKAQRAFNRANRNPRLQIGDEKVLMLRVFGDSLDGNCEMKGCTNFVCAMKMQIQVLPGYSALAADLMYHALALCPIHACLSVDTYTATVDVKTISVLLMRYGTAGVIPCACGGVDCTLHPWSNVEKAHTISQGNGGSDSLANLDLMNGD